MHGKYGDREAAVQAVALQDDMEGRLGRDHLAVRRKRRDSRKPAPPAGHTTRQHYDTALLRFERGNTAGPGGVVVPMPVAEVAGGEANADKDLAQENEAQPAAQQLASTDSAASGAALIGAKPAFAPGRRVRVLPHPEHGRHPRPFIGMMNNLIGKRGTVVGMEDGSVVVHMDEADVRIFFPPSALAIEAGETDAPAPAAQEKARFDLLLKRESGNKEG